MRSVLLLKSLHASVASAPIGAVVATTAVTIVEVAMAVEAETVGDPLVVTIDVMTEGTIEGAIAVAIGIAQSARTTISHSATNATVARLSAQAVVEALVEATEGAPGETNGEALVAAPEEATGETTVAETDAIIEVATVEEIAEGIGIALSARTTTSHSVTSATAAKQIVRAEVAPVVEVTEAAHATVETAVGTTVVDTVDATREEVTAEVQNPLIHAMVAAEEELPEAAADRADLDSEAQVVAASVATDQAEAAVDVESASPQHSSRLLVSSAYGAKRGDALDRRA